MTVHTNWVPYEMAFDGTNLWGTTLGQYVRIDVSTGQFEAFNTNNSGSTLGIAYDGTSIWVSDMNGNLYQVQPSTGAIINSVSTGLNLPQYVLWDGQSLWTAGMGNNEVARINPATLAVTIAPIPVSFLDQPVGLAMDLAGNIWVADNGPKYIGVTRFSTAF